MFKIVCFPISEEKKIGLFRGQKRVCYVIHIIKFPLYISIISQRCVSTYNATCFGMVVASTEVRG